ncbi:MAG TPA: two-component regulator propeller domain-containing protein, partial [Puia sp.]|nr:two-component regulator propeller domain-containing protein [Puia sp.]
MLGITGKINNSGSFATDKLGNILFNTTAGLKYYYCKEKKIYDERNNPGKLEIFKIHNIADILFDLHNNLWLSTFSPSQLYMFDQSSNKLKIYDFKKEKKKLRLPFSNIMINHISKGGGGNIVVCLNATGLAIYHPEKDTFSIIPIDNKNPYGLYGTPESFNGVHVLIDREGSFWAGTDKGINIFNTSRQFFYYYDSRNSRSTLTEFPSCSVSGFLQTGNDGDVYVSYYNDDGGILRLDSNLQFKKHYLFRLNGHKRNAKNQVWGLFREEDSLIWAPNQDRTILQLDTRKNTLKEIIEPDLSGNINTIQRDKKGDRWIGHWSKGLIQIDHKTHLSRSFTLLPGVLSTPVRNIFSIYVDGDSIIWSGTNQQGLLKFDIVKKEFTDSYVSNEKSDRSISSNIVKNIIPYNKDTLLMATAAGINIFDKNTKKFNVISTTDGLPNNFVQTIALDGQNNLWAGCVGGFCKINILTRTVTNYDINDGILNPIFEDPPFFRLRNGNFL